MPARESFRIDSPLLVLGGLTIFTPLFDGGTTHFPVLIVRLALLATVTTSLIVSMRSGRVIVQRTFLHLVLALFIGWSIFSVIRSPYMTVSLQWLISILSYAALLLLVQHLVVSVRYLRRLLVIILGMGIFEAALGIYQFMGSGKARPTGTFFN